MSSKGRDIRAPCVPTSLGQMAGATPGAFHGPHWPHQTGVHSLVQTEQLATIATPASELWDGGPPTAIPWAKSWDFIKHSVTLGAHPQSSENMIGNFFPPMES